MSATIGAGKLGGYIGNGPSGAGRKTSFQFAATAGQTTFTGLDQNGLTLSYTAGYVEVFLNGLCLPPTDYTASNGSSIVFASGLALNDVLYVYALSTFSVPLNVPMAMGQCILAKSGANIVLSPKNGNLITINGVNCAIPSAGISLAPTGLTPSTLYYIYAVAAAGVVTSIEASTTGHSTSSASSNVGVEIKTGDETRSLVGLVRPVTGPAFVDIPAQRLVASWFNRRSRTTSASFSTSRSTTSGSYVELNSEIKLGALLWADEVWTLGYTGTSYNSTSQSTTTGLAFDSTTPTAYNYHSSGTTVSESAAVSATFAGAEGYHYATMVGKTGGGSTGNWEVSSSSSATLSGLIS